VNAPGGDHTESGGDHPEPGGDHIEYELDDWAVESRRMLMQLLVANHVAHVWEAGRLVVPEDHEQVVDDLVDQVAATFAGTLDDPDVPRVVFDVADIDPALLGQLTDTIGAANIDWLVDGGELVVPAEFTVDVEHMVERLEFPHALELADEAGDGSAVGPASGGGTGGTTEGSADDEGIDIDPDRVLGGLFVAADRLSRSATDPRGVMDVIGLSAELAEGRAPFGFEPGGWARLQESSAALAQLLGAIDSTDVDIEHAAAGLRNQLRPWV